MASESAGLACVALRGMVVCHPRRGAALRRFGIAIVSAPRFTAVGLTTVETVRTLVTEEPENLRSRNQTVVVDRPEELGSKVLFWIVARHKALQPAGTPKDK